MSEIIYSNSWGAARLLDERRHLEGMKNDGKVLSFITDNHRETSRIFEDYAKHAGTVGAIIAGAGMGITDTTIGVTTAMAEMPSMIVERISTKGVAGVYYISKEFAVSTVKFLDESVKNVAESFDKLEAGELAEASRLFFRGASGIAVSLDGAKGMIKGGVGLVKLQVNTAKTIGTALAGSCGPVALAPVFVGGNRIGGKTAVRVPPSSILSPDLLMSAGSRTRGQHRGKQTTELPEERISRWLETKLAKIFQRIKKLLWDSSPLEVDFFRTFAKEPWAGSMPANTFTMHARGKTLTTAIVSAVKPHIGEALKTADKPRVIEFGAGSGALASVIKEETGAKVLEIDLFKSPNPSSNRIVADMTNLNGVVETGSMKVAVSSFALEYGGKYHGQQAFAEAYRVLEPDGRLVALVHHVNGGIAYKTPRLTAALNFLSSFKPLRIIIPNSIFETLISMARLDRALKKCAFKSRNEAIKLLNEVGFVDVEITPVSGLIGFGFLERLFPPPEVGWLVTARKPVKKR